MPKAINLHYSSHIYSNIIIYYHFDISWYCNIDELWIPSTRSFWIILVHPARPLGPWYSRRSTDSGHWQSFGGSTKHAVTWQKLPDIWTARLLLDFCSTFARLLLDFCSWSFNWFFPNQGLPEINHFGWIWVSLIWDIATKIYKYQIAAFLTLQVMVMCLCHCVRAAVGT